MSDYIFITKVVLLVLIIILFLYLLFINKTIIKQKRIVKYSYSYKNKNKSKSDLVINKLIKLVNSLGHKFTFLDKYSSKYDKYKLKYLSNNNSYIVIKLFILLIIFIIILIINIFSNLNTLLVFLILVLSFYSFDFILKVYDYLRKNKIKKEILKSIVILNNGFKSGKTILESIKMVIETQEDEIKKEFIILKNDINHGLSVEESFKRFSSRIDIYEIKYIATSLSLLNETGGNISIIFDSIKKNILIRSKIESEFKALTSASKIVFRTLCILPIVIPLIIYVLDNTYFNILFSSLIGVLSLIFIMILYIIYLIVIRKLLKVEL